jgi:GGDEF domain-containing protein/putative methionine-R-sulfoxide reductase with GAF domain
MVEELKRLLRLLTPVDWLAAGVILIGLLIALALDDAAVRLIGISIALLGAVAFFLLLSQRLGEELPYNPSLRSQAAQLRQTIQQEERSKRVIFDDFAETFAEADSEPSGAPRTATTLGEDEGISSVRIVGRRPRQSSQSSAPHAPTLQPAAPQAEAPAARIRPVSLPAEVLAPPASPTEPRQALRVALERILNLVRIMTPSRTVALFWLDTEQRLLVLEAWQSEAGDRFRRELRTLPLGHDIVSQIAVEGRAEIVTDIQPAAELELIPYYSEPAGTASFVGVPILLHNRPVGVLCLDSTQPHAYTATTVSLLGHVVLLISGLLQGYLQQYELHQKLRAWEYACNLWHMADQPEDAFAEYGAELFASVYRAPVTVLCLYTPQQRGWRIAALRAPQQWDHLRNALCPLERTLCGEAVYSGTLQQWREGLHRYRLHPDEPPLLPSASAYAFPLCSSTHAYGVVYCELPEPLAPHEKELGGILGVWLGGIAEHRYWKELIRGGLWFHASQGVWTEEGFRYRVAEEYERLRLIGGTAVLCALQVDRYGSLSELTLARMREVLSTHILPLLRTHLRSCDIVGYIAEDLLGVLLPGMEATYAQLWAENIRKQAATTLVTLADRRLSLTLSIGLTVLGQHTSADEALRAVHTALQRALQKGGNAVVLYS